MTPWKDGAIVDSDPADTADRLLADLAFLHERWGDLLETRLPGTPRPWRQALIDPERRAAMIDRDRDERRERHPDAPGFTSAPEHVEVLDVIVAVWTEIDLLSETISPDWRRTPEAAAVRRVSEIEVMTGFVRFWLPVAVQDCTEELAAKLRASSRRFSNLTAEASRVLGLIRAGQLLSGAVCPWCRGVTPRHPAGGQTTMRVEEIAASKNATELRPAVEAVHAVVCWNPLCKPDESACGTWYRGRPAWPWHEWEWLEKRLITAEPRVSVRTRVVPEDFTIVPVDHSGRGGYARPNTGFAAAVQENLI